ncbi:MAG TPA: metallophosphoesterase [Longimicrobiales bacterium]|nr:metallophosphoesterase [Longimicrobiales bacterium]
MTDALTILHASDLQCGRPYVPRAADAFVWFAHELAPDVIVISGDLTQRAKAHEFSAARELMDRLPDVPKVVTPGNHDVPLFRVWERTLTPYRNWRAYISRELDTVTRLEGATFVALNSSSPYAAIVDGRIEPSQVELARRAFEETPAGDVRALVVHHHFVPTADGTGGIPLPGAAELLAAFEAMDVDLILGGHVHRTHVHTSRELVPGGPDGIPLSACGTTTSRRGRATEFGINSLNVVRASSREIEIVPHLLAPESERFTPVDAIVFPRGRAAEVVSEGSEP